LPKVSEAETPQVEKKEIRRPDFGPYGWSRNLKNRGLNSYSRGEGFGLIVVEISRPFGRREKGKSVKKGGEARANCPGSNL